MAITVNNLDMTWQNVYVVNLESSTLETADFPRITTSKIGCEWDHYQLLYVQKTSGINTGSYKDLQRYGHLPVISGYKWECTSYKWGYKYL